MEPKSGRGASATAVRQHNIKLALRILYRVGAMSRADLARDMGLNRSSSGHIITDLLGDGLVRETASVPVAGRTMGRPGIMLELHPEALSFLGLEIGVDHFSVVLIDFSGKIIYSKRRDFDTRSGPGADIVRTILSQALAELPGDARNRLQGVGIAIPAHIDINEKLKRAPQIGWRDFDIRVLVAPMLPDHITLTIENDANALAIGHDYGAFHIGVTLYLLMETGVGGGILVNGELFRGGNGLAGEIGQIRLFSPGQNDTPCLEDLIGKIFLISAYRAALGDETLDFLAFIQAVQDREPKAVVISEQWAEILGYALYQATKLIDPNRIILGGDVSALYHLVSSRVQHHMRRYDPQASEWPVITVDTHERDGAAFGAACIMHKAFLSQNS